MTNKNQEKQNNHKNIIDSVVSDVAGAAVIAGVAVAATIALQDKKNRGKLKKALMNVRDHAVDYAQTLKNDAGKEEIKIKPAIKKIATKKKILSSKKAK